MLSNNTLSPIYSAWKQKKFQMTWGIVVHVSVYVWSLKGG